MHDHSVREDEFSRLVAASCASDARVHVTEAVFQAGPNLHVGRVRVQKHGLVVHLTYINGEVSVACGAWRQFVRSVDRAIVLLRRTIAKERFRSLLSMRCG